MADITFPGFYPFSDSDTASGTQIYTLLHDDTDFTASLSVLNGKISGGNMASSFLLEALHTQRGSVVDLVSASSNASIDYRSDVFGAFEFDTGAGEDFEIPTLSGIRKTYIPGANVTHNYHWDDLIICAMWTVYWNAHIPDDGSEGDNGISCVYFHIDGTVSQPDARKVANTFDAATPAGAIDQMRINVGTKKARVFSGHYVSTPGEIAGGFHTMGMAVLADPTVIMTRIYARDIVILAFKHSGS